MLGILLLYFLGRKFYRLAEQYEKSQWGYAILGIVFYYVGIFLGWFILGIVYAIFFPSFDIENPENDFLLSLTVIPFGLLVWWLTYKVIEKRFKKITNGEKILNDELLDDEFI